MKKIPVAILGATGTVGQKAIAMLQNHPLFTIGELAASERSAGKKYGESMQWRESEICPANVLNMPVIASEDVTSPYALSALPSDIAKSVEPYLANKGIMVVSNASTYRMHPDIPLLIPEFNLEHLKLIERQKTKGKIITNPNCATVFLVGGLAPLLDLGVVEHVHVVTLQAISGAGYPGVASLDILGNVIPNIQSEEEKLETECKRILGQMDKACSFAVTAMVHRVPVQHGHTVAIQVKFKEKVKAADAHQSFANWAKKFPDLYKIHTDSFRPQPLKDLTHYDQRIHIGKVRQGGDDFTMCALAMGHNLVRGAAGAALLNIEALHQYLNN